MSFDARGWMASHMAYVFTTDHEDDLLGDVRGVVRDSFDVFCNFDDADRGRDVLRVSRHEIRHPREDGAVRRVDLVVAREDLLGAWGFTFDERVQSVAHHVLR